MTRKEAEASLDHSVRMAEIVGSPPRVAPVAGNDLTPEQHDLVASLRGSAGLTSIDEIPVFVRIALNNAPVIKAQMQMGVTHFNGTIPARDRELAVLRIGWLTGAPYEWGEHVAIAKKCGISDAEVERAIAGSSAEGWSAHERAILQAVEQLLSQFMISDDVWAILAQSWDAAQLVEFPVLVGTYVTTAMQQNALRIPLEKGNSGLGRR